MNYKKSLIMPKFKNQSETEKTKNPKDKNDNSIIYIPSEDSISEEAFINYEFNADSEDKDDEIENENYTIEIIDGQDMTEKEGNIISNDNILDKNNHKSVDKKIKNKNKNSGTTSDKIEKAIIKKKKGEKTAIVDNSYKELNEIFTRYSPTQVFKEIMYINNDIIDYDKKYNELYEKLKNIASRTNLDTLMRMCLNIYLLTFELKNDAKLFSEKHEPPELEKHDKKNGKNKPNKLDNDLNLDERLLLLKGTKLNDNLYFFEYSRDLIISLLKMAKLGSHVLRNSEDKLFSFIYRSKDQNCKTFRFMCNKYIGKCEAKCKINNKFNNINLIGEHNHSRGIIRCRFYEKYPFLNTMIKWKHIQIFKIKGIYLVVRLC